VIPFDLIDGNGMNKMMRFGRLSKLYKLIKLGRLSRMLKLLKEKNTLTKYLSSLFKSNIGFERLVFLLLLIFLMCHINACAWIYIGRLNSTSEKNWLVAFDYVDSDNWTLWVAAIYYNVATFTTVGYGDIYAQNELERIVSCIIKVWSVISFAIVSGALTTMIASSN